MFLKAAIVTTLWVVHLSLLLPQVTAVTSPGSPSAVVGSEATDAHRRHDLGRVCQERHRFCISESAMKMLVPKAGSGSCIISRDSLRGLYHLRATCVLVHSQYRLAPPECLSFMAKTKDDPWF